MWTSGRIIKRLPVGGAMRSGRLGQGLPRQRIALPVSTVAVLFLIMNGIPKHHALLRSGLAVARHFGHDHMAPSRVHAIVAVSRIHQPTLGALAHARGTRSVVLESITVKVEPDETQSLQGEGDCRDIPVSLKVLDSPLREIASSVVGYVKTARGGSPRDVITVHIPEHLVGHRHEHLLHNLSALPLKGPSFLTPAVMVTRVPRRLGSAEDVEERFDSPGLGLVRRGS